MTGEGKYTAVLITGASQGIGRELALQYARHSTKLVLAARSVDKLKVLACECKRLGAAQAHPIQYDAAARAQSSQLVDVALELMAGLDILILDHVGPPHGNDYRAEGKAATALQSRAEVDFYSYVTLAQHAEAAFQRQYQETGRKGSIVVLTSILARVPFPGVGPYAAWKAAVSTYFECLQKDCKAQPHVSICICTLGLIRTETAIKSSTPDQIKYAAEPAACARAILAAAPHRQHLTFPYLLTSLLLLGQACLPSAMFRLL